ncbi:uncharacterized protein LOC131948926 [Physella acuta]|uniref:uncharacterized protein LOC131948926 n=1 Tax=Physella acuta TaxID=109671 RepID=UPI0027DE8ED8|nr:uncharacterized protein LOC131948926 [Physella acuta]
MDGKHCTCSATEHKHHVISTSLTIHVQYAAHVTRFEMTNSIGTPLQQAIVQAEVIKFACASTGNPVPFLQLYHEGEFGERTVLKNTTGHRLVHTLSAVCSLAGKFVCSGRNSLNHYVSTQEKVLRVQCDPGQCPTTGSNDVTYTVARDNTVIVELCVMLYTPRDLDIVLYKVEDNATKISNVTYKTSISYPTSSQVRANLRIEMKVTEEDQIGGYKVWLRYGNKKIEVLSFELKPKAPESLTTTKTVKTVNNFLWYVLPPAAILIIVTSSVIICVCRNKDFLCFRCSYKTGIPDQNHYVNCGQIVTMATDASSETRNSPDVQEDGFLQPVDGTSDGIRESRDEPVSRAEATYSTVRVPEIIILSQTRAYNVMQRFELN